MSKQRYINTKIWEDAWFSNLDQIEQLVFIYFLTNPMTNIVGAYEISKKTISVSTGLEMRTLDEILGRFKKDKKVFYLDGWIVLPNFIRHQNHKSPKIQRGIEIELESMPDNVKVLIPYTYGIDTISHSNTNTNTNSNTNTQATKLQINGLINSFKEVNPIYKNWFKNKTQRKACNDLLDLMEFEKLEQLIKRVLPVTNKRQYAPSITTPHQLLQKFAQLESYLSKEKTSADEKKKSNLAFG